MDVKNASWTTKTDAEAKLTEPPRALDGVSSEPSEGGVEFETKFNVDCRQWIDRDENLDNKPRAERNICIFNSPFEKTGS